jgi:streptomycin 6-kinase
MLCAAESEIVRRESSLPGLALVLSPAAFAAALRQAAPAADLRDAQITYARYKPKSFCRVAYRLDVAGSELNVEVRACRPEDLARCVEEGASANVAGPLGPGRIVLPHCAAVITVFPNDLKLTALPHLTDAAQRRQTLRELLPDQPQFWTAELRCLRYRPERRYVAELRAANGARALLKSYTRKAYSRGQRNARAFQSRGPLRIARLIGQSDRHRLLAFEWLPGRLLLELCTAPEFDGQAMSATGAALAALHAQEPEDLVGWTREEEAADLAALGSEIGTLCPSLADRAHDLARRLAARLAGAPAMRRPLHGDFTANQVLVHGPEVAILDLDWACYGDPADDLGNCLAQVECLALSGELSPGRVELVRDALLEGYAQATPRPLPERIPLYRAVKVFRRARFPFRTREPDWAHRTALLLERAEDILNSLHPSARM